MDKEEISATRRNSRFSRLRQERERRGWSQSELAERIGTTQVNVSRWENMSSKPGPYFRQRLAEVFGKSLEELGLFAETEDERVEARSTLVVPSFPQPLWNVPYRRNPFFTGREEVSPNQRNWRR